MKQINRSRWRQILDKILQGDLSQLKQIGRSIRERKNTLKIVAIIAVIILVVAPIYSVISEFVTQNTLYRNKTPIRIEWLNPAMETGRVDLGQSTSEYSATASVFDISHFASAKINNEEEEIRGYSRRSGRIEFTVRGLHEGDNKYILQIVDGKRRLEKTITIHRQTTDELNKEKAEKERKRQIEEEKKRAEEEKVRKEQAAQQAAQQAAEEASRNAAARQQAQVRQYQRPTQTYQTQAPQQPQVQCPKNCPEARRMGMHDIPRSHPCYSRNLDRDGDGLGCDKNNQ